MVWIQKRNIWLSVLAISISMFVAYPLSAGEQPPAEIQIVAGKRAEQHREMLEVIRSYGIENEKVLKALARVPRHKFVPTKYRDDAYDDSPLPIGYGQTISQPFIVAEMTRLLEIDNTSKVLEIGTGSGYQAAVLYQITDHVYTIEIIEPLAETAASRFESLDYDIHTRHGDGYYGWPEKAPFDGIVVTAAAGEIPPPLVKQLAPGGRMVIPIGSIFGTQSLMLVEKEPDGRIHTRSLMAVRFVPLTRQDRSNP